MPRTDYRKLAFCAVLLLAMGACQAIAGIEDRRLDPSQQSEASAQCSAYCDTVMDVCRGEDAVYTTPELCLAVCALLDPGDPVEPVGNTVACRQQQAKAAELEPAEHCRYLGPGGNGKCGSDCDAYCELFPTVCPDYVKYETTASCLKACRGLIDQDSFDVEADYDGDTIECRLVHLTSATLRPKEHCPHAPLVPGGPVCVGKADEPPSCEEYCKIQLAACEGKLQQFEDEAECLATCEVLTPGTNADREGNTVGCRRYHAFVATQAAAEHCSHSGPTGDGDVHCGANCDSYCQLVASACEAGFAELIGDADDCKAQCLELSGAQPDAKYSIESATKTAGLPCRVLHTTRALAGDADACDAALGAAPCDG